jgi:hypothetical protein
LIFSRGDILLLFVRKRFVRSRASFSGVLNTVPRRPKREKHRAKDRGGADGEQDRDASVARHVRACELTTRRLWPKFAEKPERNIESTAREKRRAANQEKKAPGLSPALVSHFVLEVYVA